MSGQKVHILQGTINMTQHTPLPRLHHSNGRTLKMNEEEVVGPLTLLALYSMYYTLPNMLVSWQKLSLCILLSNTQCKLSGIHIFISLFSDFVCASPWLFIHLLFSLCSNTCMLSGFFQIYHKNLYSCILNHS